MNIKEFYRRLMDFVLVSFLWFFTSLLTLLLGLGASTTSMFKVCFQIYKKNEPTAVFKLFYKTFKENFVESSIVYFLTLFIGVPYFFLAKEAFTYQNPFLIVVTIVIGYEIALISIYIYPIIAIFKNESISKLFINTIIMAHTNVWLNIKLLGSLALILVLIFFVTPFFWILFGLIYGALVSFHLKTKFNQYIFDFNHNKNAMEDLLV